MKVQGSSRAFGVALLVGVLAVAWGLIRVGDFIEDDTLISLRYSQRLVQGHGLTWTDGERVEGYSNLSWVLAVAALGRCGMDLISAVRWLSGASTLVALAAVLAFVRRLGGGLSAMTISSLTLGLTASVPVWLMGGLEQPLVMACLALALWGLSELQIDRRARWALITGSAFALLVLTRPDAPLFVVLTLAALPLLLGPWRSFARHLALLAGLPLVAGLGQLGFRLAYYGEWVPNTALIKATASVARLSGGFDYVRGGLGSAWLLVAAAGIGFALAMTEPRARRWAILLAVLGGSWLAYVVLIGGDHFPAWRHMLPFEVLAATLGGLGVATLGAKARWLSLGGPLALVVVVVATPWYFDSQWAAREINITSVVRWQWEGKTIGEMFGNAFREERPLYAVTAAGGLPYFSRLPALDLLGLNDRHIARQPPNPRFMLAHDHGDGKYVLRRAPELITFGMPRGQNPLFKSGDEMAADPSFARDYVRVRFQSLEPLTMFTDSYVRRLGRIGVHESADGAVIVPTYLFTDVVGVPHPDAQMGAMVKEGTRATFALPLAAGSWVAELQPANLRVRVRLDGSAGTVNLPQPSTVQVTLESALTTVVGRLVLRPGTAPLVAATTQAPSSHTTTFPLTPHFGPWALTGAAFGADAASGPRVGQQAIAGAHGPFFNSFRDTSATRDGDSYRGMLASPRFVPSLHSWLSFRVGGGRADGFGSQVGVRVVEHTGGGKRVRFVASGEADERLRPVRLDLGWLAGREVSIEVFDDAIGGWGHVLADGFTISEAHP